MSDNNDQAPKMPGSVAPGKMTVFGRSQMAPRTQVPVSMAAPPTMYDAYSAAPRSMAAPPTMYDAQSMAIRSLAAPPTMYDAIPPQSMAPPSTMYDNDMPPPISMAPPSVKSILLTDHDIEMATRQTAIASLAPAAQEEQEKWAQQLLTDNPNCPENNGWDRVAEGYFCKERGHAIPDDLLAEGMGGYYGSASRVWGEWSALYYPHPTDKRPERRIKQIAFKPTGPTMPEWSAMSRSEREEWKAGKEML